MKIEIEKNIPLPYFEQGSRTSKYPFAKMEVGDSFAVKATDNNTEKIRQQLYSAYRHFIFHHKHEWKFITRISDDEVRIWRIK